MEAIDLDRLKLPQNSELNSESNRLPHHKKGGKFLKGPVPEYLLAEAAQLPGKALHVYLAIWFLAGINNIRTAKLSYKVLQRWVVKRNAVYRALITLEAARLISVTRHRGQSPIVRILDGG